MLPENSLVIPWPTDCLVYANPPYGDALPDCAEKIAMEAKRGCEIIALVPARVDTEWWSVKMGVNLWLAWRGRMKFLETVAALKARHDDQVEKAAALGVKPPVRPASRWWASTYAKARARRLPVRWCTSGHGSTDLSRRSATTEPYGARHEKDIGSETAGRQESQEQR